MKHIAGFAKKAVDVINKSVISPLINQSSSSQLSIIEESCFILNALRSPFNDQLLYLKYAYDKIHYVLLIELNTPEPKNLNYLIQSDFWIDFSAVISDLLPASFISESLRFCGYFINKDLSGLYSNPHINQCLLIIFSKLESLYFKDPDGVLFFVREVWNEILSNPSILNLMVFYRKYPMLDFLSDTVLSLNQAGFFSRAIIASIFTNDPKVSINSNYRNYLFEKIFPQLIEFMLFACQCISTLSHYSEILDLFPWIDSILLNNPDFDCSQFLNEINLNHSSKIPLIYNFIFGNFHAHCLIHPIFTSIFQKLNLLINDLNGKSQDPNIIDLSIANHLSFLRIAIENKSFENLLPSVSQNEIFDIFTLNKFGFENLEDGYSFPKFTGNRVGESYFITCLMNLLSLEEGLSDSTFEQLTNILRDIFILAPDLVDANNCNSIIECYQRLQTESESKIQKLSCVKKLAKGMHSIILPPQPIPINVPPSPKLNENIEERINIKKSNVPKHVVLKKINETNSEESNILVKESEKSATEDFKYSPGAYD